MALLEYLQQQITKRVSDKVYGTSRLGQLATFRSLNWMQSPNDLVQIVLEVSCWSLDEEGELFEQVSGNGINPYIVILVANNDSIVDAQTGALLHVGEPGVSQIEKANSFEQPVMLQGDWFNQLAFDTPVTIAPMIISHIEAADALGKFS